MSRKKRKKLPVVSEKAPRTYRLSADRIAAARRALGAPTDTATIEQALDMVVLRKELVDGLDAMFGVSIAGRDD
ncbi:MAG: hypothetical protein AABZ80_06340 [Gemmatimonadota bacterium]